MGIESWEPIGKMDIEKVDVVKNPFSTEYKEEIRERQELLSNEFINEIGTLNLPITRFKRRQGDYVNLMDLTRLYSQKLGDLAITPQAIKDRRSKLASEGKDILMYNSHYYVKQSDTETLQNLYGSVPKDYTGMTGIVNQTNELEEYINARDNLQPVTNEEYLEIEEE